LIASVHDQSFELLPEKAIFWSSQGILLLADLHLGKINHFRRAGIPLPLKANEHTLEILIDLIQRLLPERIICVGDLFHSHYNDAWEEFGAIVKHFSTIPFELVLGNHDILSDLQYQRKGIVLHDALTIESMIFTHHPLEEVPSNYYNIAGHIHPGVQLRGKGRQSLTLPCFYFGEKQGVLPAFGKFTGLARIRPKRTDKVFAITGNEVIDLTTY
jgi:DNA ligase-associated metallophosphoesterase